MRSTKFTPLRPANIASVASICLALSLCVPALAFADGNPIARINLVGDLNYNVYSQSFSSGSVNYTGTGSLGYGGGILADFGLANTIGVETGALYFVRKIHYDLAAGNSSNFVFPAGTENILHIPGVIILGMGDAISLIGGVFDEIPLDSNSGSNNVGLEFGIRLSLLMSGGNSFIVDGRYNHGLTDQGGFHTNDIHALIGISFGGK